MSRKNSPGVKFTFSGHESFQCRHQWLKKGFDFVKSGKSFSDEDAVVVLGVGKNMVNSIRFWLKAFNVVDAEENITVFGEKLFNDEDGYDRFLEDEASLWLLHYQLIKNGLASTYSFVFNEFRKEKIEFTRENYLAFVKRKTGTIAGFTLNENTVKDDFDVLIKLYVGKESKKDLEESFSGLFTDLEVIKYVGKDYYAIETNDKNEIPDEVILYGILDGSNGATSINLSSIENEPNSVGTVFAISKSGLYSKIESLCNERAFHMVFRDHAGIKELQFKRKITPYTVLDRYYAN